MWLAIRIGVFCGEFFRIKMLETVAVLEICLIRNLCVSSLANVFYYSN